MMTAIVILKAPMEDKYLVFPMNVSNDVSLVQTLLTARIIPEWGLGTDVRDMLDKAIAANAQAPVPVRGGTDGQES
jgi:hypothetical protein